MFKGDVIIYRMFRIHPFHFDKVDECVKEERKASIEVSATKTSDRLMGKLNYSDFSVKSRLPFLYSFRVCRLYRLIH